MVVSRDQLEVITYRDRFPLHPFILIPARSAVLSELGRTPRELGQVTGTGRDRAMAQNPIGHYPVAQALCRTHFLRPVCRNRREAPAAAGAIASRS
jgi:hypothetical protein